MPVEQPKQGVIEHKYMDALISRCSRMFTEGSRIDFYDFTNKFDRFSFTIKVTNANSTTFGKLVWKKLTTSKFEYDVDRTYTINCYFSKGELIVVDEGYDRSYVCGGQLPLERILHTDGKEYSGLLLLVRSEFISHLGNTLDESIRNNKSIIQKVLSILR